MTAVNWGRVLTAMVTPFDKALQTDYAAAKRLAIYLVENGTDGIVVNGTTGESPTTGFDEKTKLLEAVMEAVGDRAKVIAGCGTNSTEGSIALVKEAVKVGVHGIMLVTPYYNKPPQEGLMKHFAEISEHTELPIMIYNVPGRTGVNLQAHTLSRLAKISNIVAVKEASGNLDQVTDILLTTPRDFLVYSGDDSMTLPVLSVGGYGVVSVASHVAGLSIQKMIAAHSSGDVALAAELHRQLFPLFKGLFVTTNPIPVKAALKLAGHDVGDPRSPLCPMDLGQEESLRKVMLDCGLSV